MNIGIDLISESSRSAGSMTYGVNILKSLSSRFPKERYIVFVNKECKEAFKVGNENVRYVISNWKANKRATSRRLCQQLWLPKAAADSDIDILHSINNVVPFAYRGKRVVSILDLTSFVMAGRFSAIKTAYLKSMVPPSAKLADAVVTISNYSKEMIVKICGIPDNKITVSYCGVSQEVFSESTETICPALPDEYLLFVGTIEPGKNLVRLIQAFANISHKYPGLYLVIVGRKGWLYDEVFAEVGKQGLDGKVIFTGRLAIGELINAYHRANAFVFPSLDEGFGIPVLEAMSAGCPVVTSNLSALPEITGGNALLCNPYDANDIAQKIDAILDKEVDVAQMILNGKQWVGNFTWDKTAKSIYQVYKSVCR